MIKKNNRPRTAFSLVQWGDSHYLSGGEESRVPVVQRHSFSLAPVRGFSLLELMEEQYLGTVKETFSLVQWMDSHYLSRRAVP